MRNKHTLLALALSALALQAHADTTGSTIWSNLWRNADQRGAALLQQGDPSGAAKTYTDPRGKSYAEFKAGNYAAAAQDLAALDDSEADYNRGNALAYAGNLQDALNAYDAALKRDPNNRDVHHNRDLVANALKQQAKQAPKQDQKQDQKQDGKNNPQSGQQGNNTQPGNQRNSGQSGKPGEKNDGKSSAQADASNAPNAKNAADAGGAQKPPSAPAQASAGAAAQSGQTGGRSDADQAKRDAAAGMKAGTPLSPGDTDGYGTRQPPAPKPQTEQQIAQDQWLRSIPDDPGGLLRRKFLIEHMIRQQSAQP
jgi:Ca-activated chloride channel homolog